MEIRNVTQFVQFISNNGLQTLDGRFLQLITCLNNYKAHCNCHKSRDKREIYLNCCDLYKQSVIIFECSSKNTILQKVPER